MIYILYIHGLVSVLNINIFKNVLTKECIVYCGSGMSATPLFCALLSLDEKVKVYAGSYSEWIEKNNNVEIGDFNE